MPPPKALGIVKLLQPILVSTLQIEAVFLKSPCFFLRPLEDNMPEDVWLVSSSVVVK